MGSLLVLANAGCAAQRRGEVVVLAAASLSDAFSELAGVFETIHPGHKVRLSFAGSQTLATQLREGVDADVIATADLRIMRDLENESLVRSPRVFATNRMVWILRRSLAPQTSEALQAEVAGSDWRIVLAAPEVPAGRYAREALGRLDLLEAVEARIVSQELDVRGVVAKMLVAGADAGIVYATDVTADLREELHVVELPERAQVRVEYLAAAARASPNPELAAGFVGFLETETARGVLHQIGFGVP